MKQELLRLPMNDLGRDFVVGDIHFKTIELHKGLRALGFDSAIDRVTNLDYIFPCGVPKTA